MSDGRGCGCNRCEEILDKDENDRTDNEKKVLIFGHDKRNWPSSNFNHHKHMGRYP
jgi:hypothetical protein